MARRAGGRSTAPDRGRAERTRKSGRPGRRAHRPGRRTFDALGAVGRIRDDVAARAVPRAGTSGPVVPSITGVRFLVLMGWVVGADRGTPGRRPRLYLAYVRSSAPGIAPGVGLVCRVRAVSAAGSDPPAGWAVLDGVGQPPGMAGRRPWLHPPGTPEQQQFAGRVPTPRNLVFGFLSLRHARSSTALSYPRNGRRPS
jgi:hypothetical protein